MNVQRLWRGAIESDLHGIVKPQSEYEPIAMAVKGRVLAGCDISATSIKMQVKYSSLWIPGMSSWTSS
jgi:hypothetical protein